MDFFLKLAILVIIQRDMQKSNKVMEKNDLKQMNWHNFKKN